MKREISLRIEIEGGEKDGGFRTQRKGFVLNRIHLRNKFYRGPRVTVYLMYRRSKHVVSV